MVGFGKLVKQAQKMQEDVQRLQEEIAKQEILAAAGGGAIKIRVSGDKKLKSVEIASELLVLENKEILQDLIVAAANQAMSEVDKLTADKMGSVTSALGIPGLPF